MTRAKNKLPRGQTPSKFIVEMLKDVMATQASEIDSSHSSIGAASHRGAATG